ncbi:DUF2399 domain-containing protein [Actinomadura sp. 6N118]
MPSRFLPPQAHILSNANRMIARYKARPWRMGARDYEAVLAAQRRERARIRSEKGIRWGQRAHEWGQRRTKAAA